MRSILRSLLVVCCFSLSFSVKSQVVIPDSAFVLYLTNFVGCMNGNIMDTSCPQVVNKTQMDMSATGLNIASIEGIQYFDNLNILTCSELPLTHLSRLPAGLTHLYANSCQLTSIYGFPDSLRILQLVNNPDLKCLPPLHIVEVMYLDTTIGCIPNYPEKNEISIPSLESLPLCNTFNGDSCAAYWNIRGVVYGDADNDCVRDSAEALHLNLPMLLKRNGVIEQQTYAYNGYYSFDAESGSYEVTPDTARLPFVVQCPSSGEYNVTLTPGDSLEEHADFGISCGGNLDVAVWSVTRTQGIFRPANAATVNVWAGDYSSFYGLHCADGISGQVKITVGGPASFVGSAAGALVPAAAGNVLTYTIADFGDINAATDFAFDLMTDTTAQLGEQVCITVNVIAASVDNVPANNTLEHCFTIVNSYDPNDKAVYPEGTIDTTQEWLTYTIRFQNTGNAEAQHIEVRDTFDTHIDAGAFQLLSYSHQPLVQVKDRFASFQFPHINLPDSNSNEPASHGYVQYKIKLKENLSIGTQIENTASIYFDFNPPVVTNTTVTAFGTPSVNVFSPGNAGLNASLYPNPVEDKLYVRIHPESLPAILILSDIQGRKFLTVKLTDLNTVISTSEFANGIYVVELKNRTGNFIQRSVIQR